MSRIVLATFGSFGDLHPYMAIALELQARGHQPVIATTDRYRDKVTAAGIDFHPVRPDAALLGDERELMRRVMDSALGSRYLIREIMMPNLRDAYTDTLAVCRDADLLVSHPLSYAVPIIAEQLHKPRVASVLQPMMFLSRFDAPLLPRGEFVAPLYRRWPWLAGRLFDFVRNHKLRGWDDPIQELRHELGLPRSKGHPILEGQFSPVANLAMFSPLLAPPQVDWPRNTTATGFCFYDQQDHACRLSPELAAFLDAGPPPIVFTLGTAAVLVAGDFYRVSLQAAKQLQRRAVFLVGKDERNQLGDLPDSMLAVEYAPYSELFPRAAAIVHQGGVGTTGQALRAGKPMVLVPFSQDQPDNAQRLRRLGVSKTVARHGYSAAAVLQALNTVLNNPAYAQQASDIGARVRREDGVKQVCDVLEGITVRKLVPAGV